MHKERNVQTSIRKNSDKKLQPLITRKFQPKKKLQKQKLQKHKNYMMKLILNDVGEEFFRLEEENPNEILLWANSSGLYGCAICNATHDNLF